MNLARLVCLRDNHVGIGQLEQRTTTELERTAIARPIEARRPPLVECQSAGPRIIDGIATRLERFFGLFPADIASATEIYGKDLTALEDEWRRFLEERFSPKPAQTAD
jgi:hypothetical protein